MADARITIRLDEALVQRMEAARGRVEPLPGEKLRGGLPGLSTLTRRALEAYLDRLERRRVVHKPAPFVEDEA